MKLKKIPQYFLIATLTLGACATIGFLSFSGMFALWPLVGRALAALTLSVVYEAQIYLQNIKGALDKLLTRDYLKHHLANEFLFQHFPKHLLELSPEEIKADCSPQFFKEYALSFQQLNKLKHQKLDVVGRIQRDRIDRDLRDMQKWFSGRLFSKKPHALPPYEMELLQQIEANEFLLNHSKSLLALSPEAMKANSSPRFLKDYANALKELQELEGKKDDESIALRKRGHEIKSRMEKWFALQLFPKQDKRLNRDQLTLRAWLENVEKPSAIKKLVELHASRRKLYTQVGIFSSLSAVFMSFGTIYLLVNSFDVLVPFFPLLAGISASTLPLIIVPLAILAGAGSGYRTYKAGTDMIDNNTLPAWYYKMRDRWQQRRESFTHGLMAVMAVALGLLSVGLTLCASGTWWTLTNTTRALFSWMTKIPRFVMGIFAPILIGTSELIFNLQNISETFEIIDENVQSATSIFQKVKRAMREQECRFPVLNRPSILTPLLITPPRILGTFLFIAGREFLNAYYRLRERETTLQIINPARFLLAITIFPLRLFLFLCHLISIGVTADQVPGVSPRLSAALGFLSEFFEDLHYFFEDMHHSHSHDLQELLSERLQGRDDGHDHGNDIPTRLLRMLFSPLYVLSCAWDSWARKDAHGHHHALPHHEGDHHEGHCHHEHEPHHHEEEPSLDIPLQQPSLEWELERTIDRFERFKNNHLKEVYFGQGIADRKAEKFTAIQDKLRANPRALRKILFEEANKPDIDIDTPRSNFYGFFGSRKTDSRRFLEELPYVVCAPSA